MAPHESFLAAILEQPDSDELRLGYADWLDQSCDPRGEFIRVQCRLAGQRDSAHCLFELERRQGELLLEFGDLWAEPVSSMVDGWAFERGFVDEVMMSAGRLLDHCENLCRLCPIRTIHVSEAPDRLRALTACPALNRVPFWDLSANRLGDDGARLLARCPHLEGVRGVNLSCTALADSGAADLALSPCLGKLTELYLSSNKIGDDGAQALAGSPYLNHIRTLFLNFNVISSAGAEVLRRRFGNRVHL